MVVDWDRCEANALCAGLAPQVFAVSQDATLHRLAERPGEELRSAVEAAVRSCPTAARRLEG